MAANQRGVADGLFIAEEETMNRSASRVRANRGRTARRASLASQCSQRRGDSDVKVHTAFSIGAVHRVFSTFHGEKKTIVESIGFGGLMKIHPQSRFSRLMVLWIIRNMDEKTGTIRLANGEELPVDERDVELVIGVPREKNMIRCGTPASPSVVAKVKSSLMLKQDKDISLGYLEKLLVKDYGQKMTTREREAFKIAAVLYADAYFLAPKGTKAKVNQDLFRYISEPSFIQGLNWCAYVLNVLINSTSRAQEALRRGEQKVTLDGCLFFWMVYYIDNVDFGGNNRPHHLLPRVADFPYVFVQELVGDDKCKSGVAGEKSFGQNKLRPSHDVIYSRNSVQGVIQGEARKIIQFDCATKEGGIRGSADASTVIEVLDIWAKHVNDATDVAREALLACLQKEDITTQFRQWRQGETSIRGLGSPNMQEENEPELAEANYVNLDSEDDMDATAVDGRGSTENIDVDATEVEGRGSTENMYMGHTSHTRGHLEEHNIWSTVSAVANDGIECYQNVVRRLSTISLMEMCGGCDKEQTFLGPNSERSNQMELAGVELQERHDRCDNNITFETDREEGGNQMQLALVGLGEGEFDSHGTLCVLTSAESEAGTFAIETVMENELVVDNSYLDPGSKFGISPFTINLTHNDAPLECLFYLEKVLKEQTTEQKKRKWFIHRLNPRIEIEGQLLSQMFTAEYDMGISTINAIVRLFQEMDDDMYANWREKRWRHFLPVDFAIIALNSLDISNNVQFSEIASMFGAGRVGCNVGECRLVLAPLMVELSWCLYAWDFQRNKLVVLDPLLMDAEKNELDKKHMRYVELMSEAMMECRNTMFPGAPSYAGDWGMEYVNVKGGCCQSGYTGLYAMFYARYFDGEFTTRILTKDASRLQKINILYQLLAMKGNEGDLPQEVLELLEKNSGVCQW